MGKDQTKCNDCLCHVSDEEVSIITDAVCASPIDINHELDLSFLDMGDGVCNLELNTKEYFFDVGDCCLTIQDLMCRQEIIYPGNYVTSNYVTCPDNLCIESNNFCIPENLGDGLCHDYNNSPFCDYDLGDCCTLKMNTTECAWCKCSNL